MKGDSAEKLATNRSPALRKGPESVVTNAGAQSAKEADAAEKEIVNAQPECLGATSTTARPQGLAAKSKAISKGKASGTKSGELRRSVRESAPDDAKALVDAAPSGPREDEPADSHKNLTNCEVTGGLKQAPATGERNESTAEQSAEKEAEAESARRAQQNTKNPTAVSSLPPTSGVLEITKDCGSSVAASRKEEPDKPRRQLRSRRPANLPKRSTRAVTRSSASPVGSVGTGIDVNSKRTSVTPSVAPSMALASAAATPPTTGGSAKEGSKRRSRRVASRAPEDPSVTRVVTVKEEPSSTVQAGVVLVSAAGADASAERSAAMSDPSVPVQPVGSVAVDAEATGQRSGALRSTTVGKAAGARGADASGDSAGASRPNERGADGDDSDDAAETVGLLIRACERVLPHPLMRWFNKDQQ